MTCRIRGWVVLAMVPLLSTACSDEGGGSPAPSDAGASRDGAADRDSSPAGDASGGDAGSPDGEVSLADSTTPGDGSAPRECAPPPVCDTAPPDPGATEDWRNTRTSLFVVTAGSPRHRGRDLFLREGETAWAIAKLAYGVADVDLHDEWVDVWLDRGCGGAWEMLGSALSTADGEHATVEGVEDSGGYVYMEVPAARALGLGRHRFHFVVRGDHSSADAYVDVVPADAHVVVSDVDGTLTESETAELATLFSGPSPAANPGAADALWALVRRGYHVFYLTARPDWLEARTHAWLDDERGFPRGIVHTSFSATGLTGASAQSFKTAELEALATRLGRPPDWAFGNTDSDSGAYSAAGVPSSGSFYYMFDDTRGGTRVDDYSTLVPAFDALDAVCAP